MALVKTALETKIKSVFAAMLDGSKTNSWMAAQIAAEIKSYILAGQVTTADTGAAPAGAYTGAGAGTMTINSSSLGDALKATAGVSSPFAGSGKGKFAGTKAVIETTLKACFAAMNAMPEGGDDYFAAQLAAAIDAYLKAGSVSATPQAPLSGTGAGAIA